MDRRIVSVLCLLSLLAEATCSPIRNPKRLLYYTDVKGKEGYTVTYDERGFIVDGTRTLLLSGSVHYPRSTPGMWDDIFQKMVQDGLNMVQTYIFWNLHEFKQGQEYNFAGSANWTLFVEKAAAVGLFVNLRIGPFVNAEWNYGGLPVWLNTIPGMQLRITNVPWKKEMSRFLKDIANYATPYLAKNGGPIIMAQIENECSWDDPTYVEWCGEFAANLQLDIPWLMCNGLSASNTINTCDGSDCTTYAEQHAAIYPGQPLVWTEDEGWFEEWDKAAMTTWDNRPPEDVSLKIMRWFARGGAHHNYYMWFGGNNVARWAASAVSNKYADGVSLHSDGLPNEPKKTHLQRLHKLLGMYGSVLLGCDSQINNPQQVTVFNSSARAFVNTTKQIAFMYTTDSAGVAFLENWDETAVWIKFEDKVLTLPSESSTLIDLTTGEELYCSAKVNFAGLPTERVYKTIESTFVWSAWQEDVTKLEGSFISQYPLEQLSVTQDESEYLFYQTYIQVDKAGDYNVTLQSAVSNAMLAFVDGKLQSSTYNDENNHGYSIFILPISLNDSNLHELTLLSISLGIHSGISPAIYLSKGITETVILSPSTDLTEGVWEHRAKLEGEILEVYTTEGSSSVTWSSDWQKYVNQSLVWFQCSFARTNISAGHTLLLNLDGMGRGHIYLNGMDLGRYWLIKVDGICVQQYYFIPPDLIQDTNLLTLVEDLGAPDPSKVALVDSTVVVPSSQAV